MTVNRLVSGGFAGGTNTGKYYFDSGVAGSVNVLKFDPLTWGNLRKISYMMLDNNQLAPYTQYDALQQREAFKLVAVEVTLPHWFDIYQNGNGSSNLVGSLAIGNPLDNDYIPSSVYRAPIPNVNKEYAVDQYISSNLLANIPNSLSYYFEIGNNAVEFYSSLSTPSEFLNRRIFLNVNIVIESTRGFSVVS